MDDLQGQILECGIIACGDKSQERGSESGNKIRRGDDLAGIDPGQA